MTRLTKKFNGENDYCLVENDAIYVFYATNKLGKLEDLQEQLGCLLEVIFKATENGIIDYEGKEHIVVYAEKYLFVVEDDKLQYAFHIKNYQKTWWLKGEKTNE